MKLPQILWKGDYEEAFTASTIAFASSADMLILLLAALIHFSSFSESTW
ncbi:hypothetical protein BN1088_1430496 [Sphingobacterium sp. PM2-P1-29]|nr:hypothetical protein BN1088_1430496 [Sphingobacterium sp. PM2-P1-29]